MNTQTQDFIDIKEIFSILRRQARLIVLTVAVILSIAFIFLVRATPLYTASALLLVDTTQKNLLDPTQAASVNASVENSRIESEVEILKSDSVVLQTIQNGQLFNDPEFGPSVSLTERFQIALGFELSELPTGEDLLQSTLNGFKSSLSVRRRGLTYLIAVSVTSENPERAAELANLHAQMYIEQQIASKVASALATRDVLQSQLQTAERRLSASDNAISVFIDTNIDTLESEIGSIEVSTLRSQLAQANALRLAAEENRAAASIAIENADWETLASTIGDAALASLARERAQLVAQLSNVENGSVESINLRQGIQRIEEQLASEGNAVISALDTSILQMNESSGTLMDSLREEILGSELSSETLTAIYRLQQEAAIAQNQYDTLLLRVRDAEAQALVQVADSRIVSNALPPNGPSFPNKRLVLALALVVALGLGTGLAFLNEFVFGGVTSASQLKNIVNARVGAVIPKVNMRADESTVADKIVSEPMSLFSEAFRRLRATIDRSVPDTPGKGKIIMVTSSIPAEGKSSDALAIARTYAEAGKRTLLIDADLRKPTLHKFIGTEPSSGLLEFLKSSDAEDRKDFYDADPKSPLGVIMGRRRSDTPTDAPLQSQAFQELLNKAREALDVIVIDTAPLVPVVDARYIAPYADCVVLCVRFGITNQSDLRNSYEQLMDSVREDTKIVTVLNCFEGRENTYRYSGYYGYNYDE